MKTSWAPGPEVRRVGFAGGALLHDASRAAEVGPQWLDPAWWQARGEVDGIAHGVKGPAHFLRTASGGRYVLRHYRRGGLLARLSPDRYVFRSEDGTRPFREWRLTYAMHRAGLPVPAPIAAGYRREDSTYTGDLITERLATVGSLADCLRTGALSVLAWIAIGRCIRRFHDFGVCHADLNARNILLSEEQVYLVDFDRCQLRAPGLWQDGNLVRLRRSLEKITYSLPEDRFSEADWHGLLDGYRQPTGRDARQAA